MKNYFIQFRCNQAKNKAQEELQKLMFTYENTLCDDDGLDRIVDSLNLKNSELMERYTRCKPITIYLGRGGYNYNEVELYAYTPDQNFVFRAAIQIVKREEFADHSKIIV